MSHEDHTRFAQDFFSIESRDASTLGIAPQCRAKTGADKEAEKSKLVLTEQLL